MCVCRRGLAYEAVEQMQLALMDMKEARALEPSSALVTNAVNRLKVICAARRTECDSDSSMWSACRSSARSIQTRSITQYRLQISTIWLCLCSNVDHGIKINQNLLIWFWAAFFDQSLGWRLHSSGLQSIFSGHLDGCRVSLLFIRL